MDENYVNKLLIDSINAMSGSVYVWPADWNQSRKLKFLESCLDYAERNEFYEQCAIIRDVKKTIE